MGLRVAILLAVIGGLALVGAIAFFAVPNRRGPRVVVVGIVAAVLVVATLAVFLAPIGSVTPAPVSAKLSLYLTGQVCESAPPLFNSSCGSGPQTLLNLRATDGSTRWSAAASASQEKTTSSFIGAPILRDGVLYTMRSQTAPTEPLETLLALSASDGHEIWRAPLTNGPITMQVADGQVYVLLKDQQDASLLSVFNASTGAPGKQLTLPIFGGFAVTNGLIIGCDTYFNVAGGSSSNTALAAYHASDGSLAWQASSAVGEPLDELALPCAMALGDGVLYQASLNGANVGAVRVSNGQPLWTARADSVTSLTLSGDRLIAVSTPTPFGAKFNLPSPTSDKVVALSLSDGHTLWQREFSIGQAQGPYSSASAAVDDDRLYVASSSGLRALRLSDGAPLWEQKSSQSNGGQFYAHPVVAQKTIFVHYGYSTGFEFAPAQRTPQPEQIYALNAATGEPYWNAPVYSTGFALGEV
jgi:outer membrane protein assembly factor BamB